MFKKLIFLLLIFALPAHAAKGYLTDAHLMRIDQAQRLLADVDARTGQEIIDEFNQTSFPEGNLQIYEAIAATYDELAQRKALTELEAKRSLYDSIRMNIAFLQFGGSIGHTGDEKLNQWIRQTLRHHLPEELLNNSRLFYSLE